MDYLLALTNGGDLTYAVTAIAASDDADAREMGKVWVAALDAHPDGAWLIFNAAGRLFSMKPGDF